MNLLLKKIKSFYFLLLLGFFFYRCSSIERLKYYSPEERGDWKGKTLKYQGWDITYVEKFDFYDSSSNSAGTIKLSFFDSKIIFFGPPLIPVFPTFPFSKKRQDEFKLNLFVSATSEELLGKLLSDSLARIVINGKINLPLIIHSGNITMPVNKVKTFKIITSNHYLTRIFNNSTFRLRKKICYGLMSMLGMN